MKKAFKYILDRSVLVVLGYIVFTQSNEDVLSLMTAYVVVTSLAVVILACFVPIMLLFPEQLTDDNLDLNKFPKPSILGNIRRLAWLVLYSKAIMIGMFYTGLFGILACVIGWASLSLIRTSMTDEIKKREVQDAVI